jgi:hypothetical protein
VRGPLWRIGRTIAPLTNRERMEIPREFKLLAVFAAGLLIIRALVLALDAGAEALERRGLYEP